MAEQTLKITLTADNKQALAALNQTVLSLNGVSVAAGKTGTAVAKTGKDFTGLSRVIQDLPYGFNGIANNLTQLLPAAGAAGLAFSGLVTAITFAQVGFGAWTRGLGFTKKKTEEVSEAQKQYNEQMKVGTQEAAASLATVSKLVSAAQDEKATYEQKTEILKRLNQEASPYFEGLKIEGNEIKGLAIAYQLYAENILKAAKAKGAQTQVADLTEKLVKSQERLNRAQDQLKVSDTNALVGGAEAARQKYQELQEIISGPYFSALEKIDKIVKLTGLSEEKVRQLLYDKNQAYAEGARYISQILDISKQVSSTTLADLKGPSEQTLSDFDKLNIIIGEMIRKRKEWQAMNTGVMGLADIPGRSPIAPITPPTQFQGNNNTKNIIEAEHGINQANDSLKAYNAIVAEAAGMTNILAGSFTDLSNALLQGQNFGEAIGNTFKKLAADIAAATIKAAIFSAIISALPGGGSALAALNGGKSLGFLGAFGKFLGFASGGTASGPESGYPVLLHGTESIFRPDQLGSLVNSAMKMGAIGSGAQSELSIESRLAGNDIYLSLVRTGQWRNLRT